MQHHSIRRGRLALLGAVAILFALVGSASAGALEVDREPASKATVKSVNKQLKKLIKRVAALEEKKFPDSVPPSGPARGDLAGSYPNPTVANNVIGPGKIPDESLTGFEIAPDSLHANDLATDSVGATELKDPFVVVGPGRAIPAGGTDVAYADCPSGSRVTGGGHGWQTEQNGTSILGSTPDLTAPSTYWVVQGRTTSANTLFAWAVCLPA